MLNLYWIRGIFKHNTNPDSEVVKWVSGKWESKSNWLTWGNHSNNGISTHEVKRLKSMSVQVYCQPPFDINSQTTYVGKRYGVMELYLPSMPEIYNISLAVDALDPNLARGAAHCLINLKPNHDKNTLRKHRSMLQQSIKKYYL